MTPNNSKLYKYIKPHLIFLTVRVNEMKFIVLFFFVRVIRINKFSMFIVYSYSVKKDLSEVQTVLNISLLSKITESSLKASSYSLCYHVRGGFEWVDQLLK